MHVCRNSCVLAGALPPELSPGLLSIPFLLRALCVPVKWVPALRGQQRVGGCGVSTRFFSFHAIARWRMAERTVTFFQARTTFQR